jgi:disulfide bond formation protein DsbB
MYSSKINFYLKLIFLLSFVSIFSAYYIEYIMGHQPCNLCLIERIPYALSLILITIYFVLKKNRMFFILLLVMTFSFSLIISIYHFGIEQGFIAESLVCNLENGAEIISKDELLRELQSKKISCKDVTFKILGFSLTAINIFISASIVIFLTKIFISYEKK